MSEQVKTLWLLECSEGKMGRLFTFYAKDSHDAETVAQNYLTLHPELFRLSLTCKPHGFTIMHSRRPGHIVCQE